MTTFPKKKIVIVTHHSNLVVHADFARPLLL